MPEETSDDAGGGGAPKRRRPSRRTVTLISIPMLTLWVASMVGGAFFPNLVNDHPAWLLALNPRIRHLILVSNKLDAPTYYGIGFFRLVLSDPLWFLIGYWYGDAAVEWMEKRTRTWGQMLRTAQNWFGKAAAPLVFIAPNDYICLFAGASRMSVRRFLLLNVTGTIVRLFLVRQFADLFDDIIGDFVGWIGDNRKYLLPITIGVTLLSVALEWRRGDSEATALVHLDDELEEAEREHAEHSDQPED
jgi:membrane protein DedA with SNARE-associated domain